MMIRPLALVCLFLGFMVVRGDECQLVCGLNCDTSVTDCSVHGTECSCLLNGGGIALVVIFGVVLPLVCCIMCCIFCACCACCPCNRTNVTNQQTVMIQQGMMPPGYAAQPMGMQMQMMQMPNQQMQQQQMMSPYATPIQTQQMNQTGVTSGVVVQGMTATDEEGGASG